MEIISIAGYTEMEKIKIAKDHLLPKQIKEHGLTKANFKLSDDAIKKIVRYYTREAGVRESRTTIGINLPKSSKNYCIR